MTEIDKASTPSLTEDAYAPGKSYRAIQSWPEYLRARVLANDTGDTDEPYGDYLVRRWFELDARFAPNPPKTFPELRRQMTTGAIDRDDWDTWTGMKHMLYPPVARAKNGKPRGHWELTLTYSPKWYQDDEEAKEAFRTAERKLLKYYANELVEYHSVGEYTADGRAHLHILYRLSNGGKFTDKNLTRAYPHWNAKKKVGKGVQGGHHAVVTNLADYKGYIEKELTTAWHNHDITNADDDPHAQTPRGVLEGQHRTEDD